MDQKQALSVARRYLEVVSSAHWKVVDAFLFGSQANGTAKVDSDVDIALVLDSQENGVLLQWEMMKLRHAVDIMIEPHPISVQEWNEGMPFTEEIKRTGIRIA